MDIKLTADEAKKLGFETLYVWDAFKSEHADLYDEILDTTWDNQVEMHRTRRAIIKLIRDKIEAAGIKVEDFAAKIKIRRATRVNLIKARSLVEGSRKRSYDESTSRDHHVTTEPKLVRLEKGLCPIYKKCANKKAMLTEFVTNFVIPSLEEKDGEDFLETVAEYYFDHGDRVDVKKLEDWLNAQH